MSTDTLIAPDVLTIEGIEVPCDIRTGPDKACIHTAEWVGVMKCCGHVYVICTPHHYKIMGYVAMDIDFVCKRCNSIAPGSPFASLERL